MSALYFCVVVACIVFLGMSSRRTDPLELIAISVAMGAGLCSLVALALELRRPRPMIQAAGDTLRAIYMPKKTPTLGAEALVGRLCLWSARFRIDRGLNHGEWAMSPLPNDLPSSWVALDDFWVPLTDLVVQERRRNRVFRKRHG